MLTDSKGTVLTLVPSSQRPSLLLIHVANTAAFLDSDSLAGITISPLQLAINF